MSPMIPNLSVNDALTSLTTMATCGDDMMTWTTAKSVRTLAAHLLKSSGSRP